MRNCWTGHLWQGRFGAAEMDESHLAGEDGVLVYIAPGLDRYVRFASFLGEDYDDELAW
jgi:putative transposase